MPRDIFTRIIRGDLNNPSVLQALDWFKRIADRNHFDPDVLTYPNTTLIQAYEKQTNKPMLYMPVHKVYHMEALGPAPEATGYDIAAALAQIVKSCSWAAPNEGIGELYYACTDPSIDSFCKDHGFVRMLYQSGTTTRPATDEEKKDLPAAADGAGQTVSVPEYADMPHYKFKVYR